jgi:hypothetical protein
MDNKYNRERQESKEDLAVVLNPFHRNRPGMA